MRPLWQILISFKQKSQNDALTCDECFQYMEHLVEKAIAGADQDSLEEAVKIHLMNCPDCRDHHLEKIEQLETHIATRDNTLKSTLKTDAN